MSNFTDFIGGGGGGGLPVNIVLGHSQTWVPPADGNICIHVVGAGGGGHSNNSDAYIRSGGAGGYCKKNSLAVTTSGSFTVVVGAGGAGGTLGASTGGTGGTSTVAGTGLSAALRAFGGTGASTSLGVGGLADGGDVNNTGGAGGYYGGGAVGITGTGNSVGTSYYNIHGADCDVVGPESLMGYGYICGGLGGRAFNSKTNNVSNYRNAPMSYGPDGNGGFLAGGGQFQIISGGIQGRCIGGKGGTGGGGGGCVNQYSNANTNGGDGGNGIVIIQYLPA